MGILSLPLLIILFGYTYPLHHLPLPGLGKDAAIRLKNIRELGLFALVFGVLTQLLGLLGALESIEVWGSVTLELLLEGIRTSFIPAIYGLIIALLAVLLTHPRLTPKLPSG